MPPRARRSGTSAATSPGARCGLIADGIVDREGVPGLARRVGYSERQLHRVLVAEVGAGPIALARAQRAQTARILLETTDLPTADVAFAAGFASVRQFNDTVRDVFATTPTGLRAARRRDPAIDAHPVWSSYVCRSGGRWICRRCSITSPRGRFPASSRYTATPIGARWRCPNGAARAEIRPGGDSYLLCRLELAHQRDLVAAVARLRRLLDLDADPAAVDAALGARPELATLVTKRPGLRSPGTVDGFELAVRAVVGQQVSVAGARRCWPGWSSTAGPTVFPDEPSRLFPTAPQLAAQDPSEMPMPKARAATLRALAEATGGGAMALDPGSGPGRGPGRAARSARHRSVDGRLRCHAGARRSRHPARDRPRRATRGPLARSRPERRTAGLGALALLCHPSPVGGAAMSLPTSVCNNSLTHEHNDRPGGIPCMRFTVLDSPLGGLLAVRDDGRPHRPVPADRSACGIAAPTWRRADADFDEERGQLAEYFAGTRMDFELTLNPAGTPFQLAVWSALREIPYGETASYGKIAAAIGRPDAARAVGWANGQNPIPIIVPVPPRHRRGRLAHRLRRRAAGQALAAGARGGARRAHPAVGALLR